VRIKDFHLVLVAACLLITGILVARWLNDVHVVQRFGSLISGAAALFVFGQVSFELALEKEKEQLQTQKTQRMLWDYFVPRELLEATAEGRRGEAINTLVRRRMRFVLVVALTAMVGEIVHGFGDILCSPLIKTNIAQPPLPGDGTTDQIVPAPHE
jgi:hypothetical protein